MLLLCEVGQTFDPEQREFTQLWRGPQQTVLLQHLEAAGQLVEAQQVVPAAMQNGVVPVVQQVCPAAHDVFPQQKPAEALQNFPPVLFVQQVWDAAHDKAVVVPQQIPAETEQYVDPLLRWQQVWDAAQEVVALVPQQTPPAWMQKLPGQQVIPARHFGEQLCAAACLIPRVPTTEPNSKDANRPMACRRGIGLAKMRAASSARLLISRYLRKQVKQERSDASPTRIFQRYMIIPRSTRFEQCLLVMFWTE
jgi:hypothetical protein